MKQLYNVTVSQFRKDSCPFFGYSAQVSENFYIEAPSIFSAGKKAVLTYRANGTMMRNFRHYSPPEITEAKLVTGKVVR